MTAYRCREHPDEPVTWRGTGCAWCAPGEHRVRRRRRAATHTAADFEALGVYGYTGDRRREQIAAPLHRSDVR